MKPPVLILTTGLAVAASVFTGLALPGANLLAASSGTDGGARPQQAPASLVDVVVVSDSSKPIPALKPEDFRVSVDGQPRRVLSARYAFRGPGAEASAVAAGGHPLVEPSRLVLFAIDETSILPRGEKAMVSALWRAQEVLGPADRVGLVTLPLPRRVMLSADRQALRDTAAQVVGRGAEPSRFAQAIEHARPNSEARPANDETEPNRPDASRVEGQPPPSQRQETAAAREGVAQLAAAADGEGDSERPRSTSLQALTRTVAALRALPGSKTVVLLWGGAAGADPRDTTRPVDLRADMPALIEEAAGAHVTIHVVLVPRTAKARLRNSDLDALAAATGGVATTVPTEGQSFAALASAMSGAYRLEIEVKPVDTDVKPHDLSVSISRPGLKALAPRRWVSGAVDAFAEPGVRPVASGDVPPGVPAAAAPPPPPAAARPSRSARGTDPALFPIVSRVSEYVEQYVRELSSVVAEEEYSQRVTASSNNVGRVPSANPDGTILARRRLKSDLLLLQTAGPDGWVPFRDVVAVDGKPVPDRDDRLRRLFLEHPDTALAQAGKITEESARYNLGGVHRTVNQPTLVLAFLMPGYVSGFRFEQKGEEEVEGARALRLDYEEVASPTIIRQGKKGSDVPAKGSIWVDSATGRVLRTRVLAKDGRVTMEATVTFRRNDDLGVWTPAEMTETYEKPGEVISGIATYKNFRRFRVTTEERIK